MLAALAVNAATGFALFLLRRWSACSLVSVSRWVQVVVGDGVVVAPFDEGVVEALGYDLVFVAVGAVDCADVVGEVADVAGATEGEVVDSHPRPTARVDNPS